MRQHLRDLVSHPELCSASRNSCPRHQNRVCLGHGNHPTGWRCIVGAAVVPKFIRDFANVTTYTQSSTRTGTTSKSAASAIISLMKRTQRGVSRSNVIIRQHSHHYEQPKLAMLAIYPPVMLDNLGEPHDHVEVRIEELSRTVVSLRSGASSRKLEPF